MRILLSGATGLIGQAARRRLAREHEVFAIGRGPTADLVADLAEPATIGALALPAVDAVVHCAGVVDEDFRTNPARALAMAFFGADALASAAVAAGATRLIYISSAHVYGPMVGCVDEKTAVNPVSDYAIAHFATEQVFQRHVPPDGAGLALRPCAVFGVLERPENFRRWSLIPFSFPRDAVLARHIEIRSTGEQQRNFVGSDDIAEQVARFLAEPDASGWNVLNPLGVLDGSVFEFARLCTRLADEAGLGPCTLNRVTPVGATPGDDFVYTSLSPLARGAQSPEAALRDLMLSIAGR